MWLWCHFRADEVNQTWCGDPHNAREKILGNWYIYVGSNSARSGMEYVLGACLISTSLFSIIICW